MELFGVAIVLLLVGITLVVLARSADGRAVRQRGGRGGSPASGADRPAR